MNKTKTSIATFILGTICTSIPAQEWLDKVDDSLFFESSNGAFRTDLSGLLDTELYYAEQPAPGMLFSGDEWFFNPRLSLFLDTKIGDHLYSLVQVRFDRGFDPGAKPDGDARFDEYLLRYTPFDGPQLNIQAGKFATVVGNWVARHDSWNNPFITAPALYENVMIASDHTPAPSRAGFLGRRNRCDLKPTWNSIIWGPSYASGASVFGLVEKFEYAFEVKNAGLSSRPSVWDATERGFDHPTVSGRLGVRPNAAWNVGANASYGGYLVDAAQGTLPRGTDIGDYQQLTVGPDISFAWHHWQFWAEAYASRFDIPRVGDVETAAYYLEAKYKIDAHWFAALRWNQQIFEKISNGFGGETRWDRNLSRIDLGLGYRFNRHLQSKIQYSYSDQNARFVQGEQMVAFQLTLKF